MEKETSLPFFTELINKMLGQNSIIDDSIIDDTVDSEQE